jgi:type II secretory pathway component PulF
MNPDDLIALNEEIAAMARAGLPLDQGLSALAREMGRGRLQQVTAAIAEDMRRGQTLAEALDRQADRVPPYYGSLVTAGVRTGRIGDVLTTLTGYARNMSTLRNIIFDALAYPLIVLVFSLGIIFFLLLWVMPTFADIFQKFNMKLPAFTEGMLALGRHPVLYLALPVGIVLFLGVAAWLIFRSTPEGRRTLARFVYALPLFGTLIRSARLAAFTDLLAILIDHQVPLPEAFRLAGAASSDPLTAARARQIHLALTNGQPLGQVLHGQGLVPEWVAWMAGLGEKRNQLGTALHQVAEMYRRQVEIRANLLRSLLPPLCIIGIGGLVVAAFVFALFLPMFKLLEGLSK